MLSNLWQGLTILGTGSSIAYLFAGAIIGMFIGVIPGLGGPVVLSIVLVFVYHINLVGTVCLFLGTHAGSYYSASVTSILLNTPAHPEAFAVTFDGYPMATRGEPGRALGLSAASTCIGGLIGCLVLVGFVQILPQFPDIFHPPEYVALVTLAMLLVGTLGTDSVGKAIAAAGAGLSLSAIGPSIITGVFRYTFDSVGLYSGISLVALALGVFAVPQMAMIFGTGTTVARQDMTGKEMAPSTAVEFQRGIAKQVLGGVAETFRHWVVLIQGGLVGALTGIVPGIGGFAANFLSYGIAQQTSKKRDQFGTGIPEGIIAPEAASLAKEAGSMIPIIGLGIPGGVGGALFLASLTIKGIRTGSSFTTLYPTLPYEIMWVIGLSGIIGTVAGVLVGPFLAKVTRVPGPLLVPFVLALCVVGPFVAEVSFFSVVEVLIFGLVGLALRRLRYPLGSFILGLVLGPTFETNVYLTHVVFPGVSFFVKRPLADVFFFLCIVVLGLKISEIRREKRKVQAALKSELADVTDETERRRAVSMQQLRSTPYPLLAPLMSIALLGSSLFFVIYGASNYTFRTALMPVIGGTLIILPMLFSVPRDVYRYVFYRRCKSQGLLVAAGPPVLLSGGASESTATPPVVLLEAMDPAPMVAVRDFPAIVDRSWSRYGQFAREAMAFTWLGLVILLCWLFGFVWGVPAFMLAYGLTSTKRFLTTPFQRILYSVLSAAAMWFVTYEIFHIVHLLFTPVVNF